MEEYIKWLENMIEVCLEDKDLQREHWAFCQALKKCRELSLCQPDVSGRSEQLVCDNHRADLEHFMNYSESICKTCKQKV